NIRKRWHIAPADPLSAVLNGICRGTPRMNNAIDRYIFRTTLGAFLLVLVSLTGIIWITQALREIDLVTNQGQTILVFLGITALLIPILAQVIAPIAFVIAVVYAIDKLNGDAELVVMTAAAMSRW